MELFISRGFRDTRRKEALNLYAGVPPQLQLSHRFYHYTA